MKIRIAVLAAAVALAGCSSDADPNGGSTPEETTNSGEQNQDPEQPEEPEEPSVEPAHVVETDYFGNAITMSVYPIQAYNDQYLAQIDLELAADAEEVDLTWVLSRDSKKAADSVSDLRLVDREGRKIYEVATDSAEAVAGTNERADLQIEPGGEPASLFAYFAGPEAESLDLLVPLLGYVADIPVTQISAEDEFAVAAADFGVSGSVESESHDLTTRLVAYDELSNVREEDEAVLWTLASDVLFDYGEHKLDKKAKKVIEDTIEEIKDLALEDGEIHLVGHTDDQGSTSFNQDLSEKRAKSVQKIFEDNFPSSYKITSEGKGKLEPAVEGTSEEARKANRRVEIQFVAKEDAELLKRDSGEIPDTEAPTVTGNEQMEFEYGPPGSDQYVGVRVESVTELDSENLVGVIEVELLEGFEESDTTLTALFSKSAGVAEDNSGRSVSAYTRGGGTGLLTLATSAGSLYPLEYVIGETDSGSDRYDVLGDTRPMGTYQQGDIYRLFAVWPNPGTDTVTIEVPDRMRFADVPVE